MRLVFQRTEDFAAANPAPGQLIDLELGVDARRRRSPAIRGRIVGDRGGLGEMGVESISTALSAGPYRWDAHDLTSVGVTTNRVVRGRLPRAGRAAGGVRGRDADRPRWRPSWASTRSSCGCRTCSCAGDAGVDGAEIKCFGARECLEARARRIRSGASRDSLPEGEGIGVAVGFWPGGLEPAAAICKLDGDGKLTVVTAAVGHERHRERVHRDRRRDLRARRGQRPRRLRATRRATPYGGVAGGSKITYTYGRAIERAAEAARERLLDVAPPELEIAPEDLELVDGEVRPVGAPGRAVHDRRPRGQDVHLRLPARPDRGLRRRRAGLPRARAPRPISRTSASTARPARVTVLAHVIAQDVGKALNPALVEGQMHGGTAQGIGWALLEELAHDENGQLRGGSFAEYALPSTDQVPPIETLIVEVPAPDGPFGAKGIGEPPVCGVPGAIANAIAAASGARLTELPMSPLRVWRSLNPA